MTLSWIAEEDSIFETGTTPKAIGLFVNPKPTQDFHLSLEYIDQTATAGVDYWPDQPVCKAGQNCRILIQPVDDTIHEGDETFLIQIVIGSLPSWVTVKGNLFTRITIDDNDSNSSSNKPTVSIAGGPAITEGGAAAFTLTTTPITAIRQPINVTVTQSGTFAASGQTGARQVTIGPSGTARFTVLTQDDGTDEPHGAVTATVHSRSAYKTGTADAATVAVADNDDPPPRDPEATFATAAQVAGEGAGTRNIQVNLTPAPTTALTLHYSVSGTATAGSDYTISGSGTLAGAPGATTASIPVALVNDSTQEVNETVILTLMTGSGYTVGSPSTHTLTIRDNDAPPPPVPEASFAATASTVDEGVGETQDITVNVFPAPTATLTLAYEVSGTATQGPDYSSRSLSGSGLVRAGETTGPIRVFLEDDSLQESDETVILTLATGEGYTVGDPATHTLTITDNDTDQPTTDPPTTTSPPPEPTPATPSVNLGTQPSAFPEGRTATYTVVLSTRPTASVTITPTSADPAAVTVAPATLTFTPTTWETPQRITVTGVADADAMRERVTITHTAASADARYRGLTIGTMTITVTDTTGPVFVRTAFAFTMAANQVGPTTIQTSGGQVAVVQATGVGITYSLAGGGQGRFAVDPVSGVVTAIGAATPPGTYPLTVQATDAHGRSATAPVVIEVVSAVGQRLTRVRRTVLPEAARLAAGSAFAAVSNRLGAARTATRLRVAGYDLTEASAPPATARTQDRATDATPQTGPRESATLDLSQVLAGSTFTLPLAATGEDRGGLRPVLWGTVDWNALTGSGTAPDWDGEMLHAQLGADLQVTEHLLAGLALSHDRGTFDWTDASAATGTLSSHLTSLLPYLGWTLHDRVALWAAASLGRGEVSLEDTEAGTFDSPATAWSTGVGVRGALLPAGPTALALKAEAWLAQWTAAATGPVAALDTDVQRLRLALEGQRAWRWADGAALTPALALGVRHDGGEGETGTGLELGGGVQWHDPGRGLTLRAQARTLLGRGEYRQWGAGGVVRLDPGADGRGLTLSLAPTWGAAASGGVARLWEEGLTGRPAVGRGPAPQLTAAVGYGLAAPGTPGTVTPYAGLALAGGQAQTWRTGLRLAVNTGLDAHLETTRREQPGTPPVHGVTLQTRLRF